MIASFSHGSSQKSGNQAVVLVNAPVPLPPVVELAGGHAQRRDEPSDGSAKAAHNLFVRERRDRNIHAKCNHNLSSG